MVKRLLALLIGSSLLLAAGCASSSRYGKGAGGPDVGSPDFVALAPFEQKILELIAITDALSADLALVTDLASAAAVAGKIRAANARVKQLSDDLKEAEEHADWLSVTWLKLKYRGRVAEFKGRLESEFQRIAALGPDVFEPIREAMEDLKAQLKNKDTGAAQGGSANPPAE